MPCVWRMAVNILLLHKRPLLSYSESIMPSLCISWPEIPMNCINQHSSFFLMSLTQMAYRLLVRRMWTLSAKDIRCLPASTATTGSSCFSTSLKSATTRVSFLSASRTLPSSLPHTSRREVSFNVQDHEDFTERVINSQLPVLIDFHAQ